MKPISFIVRADWFVLWLVLSGAGSLALQGAPIERVLMKEAKLFAIQDGKTEPLRTNISLSTVIRVTTNGTFDVNQGKERKLKEGQILSNDGMLISPDGSLVPVVDHVTMKNGQVLLVKDGEPSPLKAPLKLADGTSILPDGTIVLSKGQRTRMLDGQLFKLDGSPLPVLDTVTLKEGKVVVQKDGSLLTIPTGRSVMMSDGTKVFGDGTLVKRDGSKIKLVEGQIFTVEGVTRRTP